MFAYVKDLSEGTKLPYSIVHCSRIFQLLSVTKRMKFDHEKFDQQKVYAVVKGVDLVRHQILLLGETQELLQEEINKGEYKSRRLRAPKTSSLFPITHPIKRYTLVEEAEECVENNIKKKTAKAGVALKRENKIASQLLKKKSKVNESVNDVDEDEAADLTSSDIGVKSTTTVSSVNDVDKTAASTSSNNGAKSTLTVSSVEVVKEAAASTSGVSGMKSTPPEGTITVNEADGLSSDGKEGASLRKSGNVPEVQQLLAENQLLRNKCAQLEAKLQESMNNNKRFDQIDKELLAIKDHIKSMPTEQRSVRPPPQNECKLSKLRDAAETGDNIQLDIPEDKVHMGDQKYFISKSDLVKAERATGLRPRLAKVLEYMYSENVGSWKRYGPGAKVKDPSANEIPDSHVAAFIVVLKAMNWHGKQVNLSFDHVCREITKALSEVNNRSKTSKTKNEPKTQDSSTSESTSKSAPSDLEIYNEQQ